MLINFVEWFCEVLAPLQKERIQMAYVAAVISAIAMAMVYLTDKIMKKKTYDRPSQPMFVSSLFSVVLGIVLLLVNKWDTPLPSVACWMSFGAGVLLMMANLLYFTVLYSNAGEVTEVACFESSSVIVIVLITFFIGIFGVKYHDSISTWQWIGVIIGALGLIAVHVLGEKMEFVDGRHRLMLIGFMIFMAAYELVADRAIYLAALHLTHHNNPEQVAFLRVSPYFWLGLATGIVAMFPKKEWKSLYDNMSNLKRYWWTIAIVEGLAIIAFGAAVLGFAEGHVAVIALIAGTFPILVLIGGVILRKVGFEEDFTSVRHPFWKASAVIAVIVGAILAA